MYPCNNGRPLHYTFHLIPTFKSVNYRCRIIIRSLFCCWEYSCAAGNADELCDLLKISLKTHTNTFCVPYFCPATVHLESAWLFPYFVTLLPYTKFDFFKVCPHQSTPSTHNDKANTGLDFLGKCIKNKKQKHLIYISIQTLSYETRNWAQMHPISIDHPWGVSTTWLESNCGKFNWLDMIWKGTQLSI
jgi:hypothetical protein